MSPRVLIIDNSPVARLILQTSLRRTGIKSVAYADGLEVFTALREQPDLDPDVVLLDTELPAIDGYSLVPLLKAQTRLSRCTFIMLSQRDGVLDRIKGRLAGASDYLTKPFDTKQVVALVQEYLTSGQNQRRGATDQCTLYSPGGPAVTLTGQQCRHTGVPCERERE